MQNNTFSRLIVGQKIVVLERIDSTNNYIKRELAKSTPFPDGTVIMAEEQYSGRGQADNKWISDPGLNLTFSILLYPAFITPENQFDLNIAVSLAINDVLTKIIGSDVKIKWPNDIYFRNQKIGGVLIENSIQGKAIKSSIIGIGLNVNQTEFDPHLVHINSLKRITGNNYNVMQLLTNICEAIGNRINGILESNAKYLDEYQQALFRFNVLSTFTCKGKVVDGYIKGVDENGRLILLVDDQLFKFSLKEISYNIGDLSV